MTKCVYLIGVHLSDNKINEKSEFYYEVLDYFNITEQDVLEINRSMVKHINIHPNIHVKYGTIDIDYNKCLEQYFDFERISNSLEDVHSNSI